MAELSAEQREGFGRALAELRQQLREGLSSSAEGARPVSLDEPIGRVSRVDALQQQSMLRANREAAKRRLVQVEAALRRLEEGRYGDCAACGEAIDRGRLRARPEAPLCLACQSEREQVRR